MTENTNNNIANEYNALWVMLAQAKNTIAKARQRDSAQLNITDERRRVLWSIQNNDGQATPVEISHQLLLEIHSVTAMLNRMEKEGLIQKFKGEGRSRSVVRLTPKGLEVFNQSLFNELDQKIFSVLTKREREQMMASLLKVRNQALRELGVPLWRIKFPLDSSVTQKPANKNSSPGK